MSDRANVEIVPLWRGGGIFRRREAAGGSFVVAVGKGVNRSPRAADGWKRREEEEAEEGGRRNEGRACMLRKREARKGREGRRGREGWGVCE